MAGQFRVYSACSLDGFLAGENDDLSWLPGPEDGEPVAVEGVVTYEAFMADVGVILMGRRTFDVVRGFGEWPYGQMPVRVLTHRALPEDVPDSVCAIAGELSDVLATALSVANGSDVYVDGGSLIRQVMDAGRIDEWILTVVPTFLGRGIPVYGGEQRHELECVGQVRYGRMVQLRLTRKAAAEG
jgi:dihydrofolate reductase